MRLLLIASSIFLLQSITIAENVSETIVQPKPADSVKNSTLFWDNLMEHCGETYRGYLPHDHNEHEIFSNEELYIHIASCTDNEIRIPFQIGDDRSRTFVFTKDENEIISFKHHQCFEDGKRAPLSLYGGRINNYGYPDLQVFPADPYTADLYPEATSNVWWWALNRITFSYNLKRLHSRHNPFTINFDIMYPLEKTITPWECDQELTIEDKKIINRQI